MGDYIPREAAIALTDQHSFESSYDAVWMEDALKELPAADVKPVVHSEWLQGPSWSEGFGMGESYGFYWDCLKCHKRVRGGYDKCDYDFCPNCGADMRPPKKETEAI